MRRGVSIEERIADLSMPIPFSGCHIWLGAFRRGYPAITVDGKRCRANRVVLACKLGVPVHELPRSVFACHKCDERECVNPDHIFPGTHQDNVDDKVAKGRQARVRHGGVHMDRAKADELIERKRRGESTPSLAKAFGLAEYSVRRIAAGKRWRKEVA